jgi:hypothetical protein
MATDKTSHASRKTQDIAISPVVVRLASLKEHLVNGGRIERAGEVIRLVIPPTTSAAYTDAQLDDYQHELPRAFANRPPQRLHVRARFSHPIGAMKGTAGFGFWNHPFTREGGVIEPPRNLWFFYGSPESNMQIMPGGSGHGFKAATLNTPLPNGEGQGVGAMANRLLMAAGNLALKIPLVSSAAMAAARRVIVASERQLDLDVTAWHDYALGWVSDVAVFRVDGQEVLRATKPPLGPLGFVAWVDNYRATATPDGRYEFAYVDVPEAQWMEMTLISSE